MRAVILSGGYIRDYEAVKKHIKQGDLIICADSGVHHAFKMGVIPHLVVGDMDSISEEDKKKVRDSMVRQLTFPREKDFTDTELALDIALKEGVKEAVLLAGLGDRPDHSLSNVFLMVSYKKKGMTLIMAGENWEMFLVDGRRKIRGKKGHILSLIPITPKVSGIKTSGLYYPLNDDTLFMGTSRGISNVFLEDEAVVEIKEGMLLAVKWTEESE
ncbi:MAG: thiamine diphosphokinase [Thermosediminibacteraceae bacterium]|nr:thiamine diphosphokinase [Thermosediminibacteraceae bacterium]